MTTADLPARIRAAIDHAEQMARYSGGTGSWDVSDAGMAPDGIKVMNIIEGRYVAGQIRGATRARFVAEHDPASVLRRCAADRRILERHARYVTPATRYVAEKAQCEYCASLCHSHSGLGCDEPYDAPWPCPDVRDLAEGYGVEVDAPEPPACTCQGRHPWEPHLSTCPQSPDYPPRAGFVEVEG